MPPVGKLRLPMSSTIKVDEEHSPKFQIELAQAASHWFAFLAALAYATGFLCLFTFLDQFGIRDSGGDFFRVRYIHVGILFLLFPVCILTPLWVVCSLKRAEEKPGGGSPNASASNQQPFSSDSATTVLQEKEVPHAPLPRKQLLVPVSAIFSYLNMCFVLYIVVLFAPRDFAATKQGLLVSIFLISIFSPRIIEWFVKSYIVPHKSTIFSRNARWAILLSTTIPLDYLVFGGLWHRLWIIFWGRGPLPSGAIFYIAFLALIPYTLWRTNEKSKAEAPTRKSKTEMRVAAVGLCLMYYFLAILSFSIRVYPFIPTSKGGGDFSESPTVRITFKPHRYSRPAAQPMGNEDKGYVVLDETQDTLFVAKVSDVDGPQSWRFMEKFPPVTEIRRDEIERMVYDRFEASR